MKTRTVLFLAGTLVLLGIVALLARRSEERRREVQAPHGELFPDLRADAVQRLEIAAGGTSQVLEKKDGAWRVMPEGFQADPAAVAEALDKLDTMRKVELASRSPQAFGDLEVEGDRAIEVKAWTRLDGEPDAHLMIGKSGPDWQSSYVRIAGEDQAYRTATLARAAFDRQDRGWRDRTIFRFEPEQARRIVLESQDGRTVLERGDGGWRIAEPAPAGPARDATVDLVLGALSNAQADGFATVTDPQQTGLAAPLARSRVELADGTDLELLWGAETADGRVYARRADGDTVYELQKFRRTSVFPEPASLRPEPEPEPALVPGAEPGSGEAPPEPSPLASPAPSPAHGH